MHEKRGDWRPPLFAVQFNEKDWRLLLVVVRTLCVSDRMTGAWIKCIRLFRASEEREQDRVSAMAGFTSFDSSKCQRDLQLLSPACSLWPNYLSLFQWQIITNWLNYINAYRGGKQTSSSMAKKRTMFGWFNIRMNSISFCLTRILLAVAAAKNVLAAQGSPRLYHTQMRTTHLCHTALRTNLKQYQF